MALKKVRFFFLVFVVLPFLSFFIFFFGALLILNGFVLGGCNQADKFLQASHLFTLAESLGGVESLAEVPDKMTHAGIPEAERLKVRSILSLSLFFLYPWRGVFILTRLFFGGWVAG